jgi:AraC-like DNA-binding protein
MSQDPLSDIVRVLNLTGALFLEGRFSAPWSFTAKVSPEDCAPFMDVPAHVIAYHVVADGHLHVEIDGVATREVGQGEIVLLPRNDAHTLSSEPGLSPIPGDDLILPPGPDGLARISFGGGGNETRILCGFLASNAGASALLDSLPALLTVPVGDVALLHWVEASIGIAARELGSGRVAAAAVMSRLVELLFVEALRRYGETGDVPAGWLRGMQDERIGRALSLMHGDLARAWTVKDLAKALAMSRTAFVDRFVTLVGTAPIRYLTETRLSVAQTLLRDTRLTTHEIAYRVGYEAPAAFSRAFKRATGSPPGAWRARNARVP